MPKQNREPGIHLHKTTERRRRLHDAELIAVTEWHWILIAKNGKTIAKSSETYKRKAGAVRSINAMLNLFDAQDMCLYYDHTPKGKENEPDLFVIR